MSTSDAKWLYRGVRDCPNYLGDKVEKRRCKCGVDTYVCFVSCAVRGDKIKAVVCRDSCPHRKEKEN